MKSYHGVGIEERCTDVVNKHPDEELLLAPHPLIFQLLSRAALCSSAFVETSGQSKDIALGG